MGRQRHEGPDPRKFRRYTEAVVQGLLEGEIWTLAGPKHVPSWAQLRSSIEHHGAVESEAFLEVMDLERALQRLTKEHPDAASVITLQMMLELEPVHLESVFGRHRNWGRLYEKGKAWLASYLAGKGASACEAAYRKAH